jgi:hypothetical protein
MSDLLTIKDLYQRWGGRVAVATINTWRCKSRSKGPPFLKLGGKVVYRLADVEEWEIKNRRS